MRAGQPPDIIVARDEAEQLEAGQGLSNRSGSWIIVPPSWASIAPGCDYCNARNAPRFALLVCLLAAIIFVSRMLTGDRLQQLLAYLDRDPLEGSIYFVALLIVAHVVAFPGAVLALAAGAIFGLIRGTILTVLGIAVGQVCAFCVGRYLLRDMVVDTMARKFPKWPAIDAAISKEGWKLITLLRLSPVIPWNILNFALSVTGVRLSAFALSSAVAIIPWTTTFVYFGSLAKSMADIFDGRGALEGASSYLFFLVSGILLVVVVAYTTTISRRAIREALVNQGGAEEIVEELDSLALLTSPRADPLSPGGWSRPIGWARSSFEFSGGAELQPRDSGLE